jgi:hypothetical protein
LTLAGVLSVAAIAQAQPALQPPTVNGPQVNLAWSAVPNAESYVLRVGVAPGVYLINHDFGNVTTGMVAAPLTGTFYAVIQPIAGGAPFGPPSNEVPIVVTSLFLPPAPPANLEVFFDGRTAHFSWAPGVGGGAPLTYLLQATSGGVPVASLTVNATHVSVANVPAAPFIVSVVAINQGGPSAPSAAVEVNIPPGPGLCSTPPARGFNTFSFGRFAQFAWTPLPGAAAFRLDFTNVPGGPSLHAVLVSGNASLTTINNAPLGTFYGRLSTQLACGSVSTGPEQVVNIDGKAPPGPRAPDPAPGQRLPFPGWGAGVVSQLAAERPDLLRASCAEHGGNNRFMFEAVRRLRQRDNRFGLNWKRGNYGDLSQDIVNYNFSAESDEGTRNVYIIDIIAGHCGSRPGPNWADQTEATRRANTRGIWTLVPYINAGYPIVP